MLSLLSGVNGINSLNLNSLFPGLLLSYLVLFLVNQIGYRDGLIAGQEASAQEGFNIGFKDSVLIGYNWGLVRGITR